MPERRPRADRAQQFMPFAALKGYYDLIRERERVAEPKRELTDEQALELSRKLSQLKRREMACIVHYDGEAYVTARGLVSDIVRMQNVKFVNGVCMGSFSANLGDGTVGIVA